MRELIRRGAWAAAATLAVALVTLPLQRTASATIPILGDTFSGTASGVEFGCLDPAEDGPFSDAISFTVVQQVGPDFVAEGQVVDAFGASTLTITGVILDDGTVSGSFVDVAPGFRSEGGFSGQLVGDVLSFSFAGFDVIGDTCEFGGDATLIRSAAAIIPGIAPGNVVTTIETTNQAVRTYVDTITTRVSNVLSGRMRGLTRLRAGMMVDTTGMSASEGTRPPLAAWASFSYSNSEDDFVSTAFESDRFTGMVGIDVSPDENWVLGVAFGLERNDVQTRFNGGAQESTGMTVAPYVGAILSDTFSFDATVGYSTVNGDQFRTVAATGARVTSETESDRFFGSANLTSNHTFGNLLLSGRAGVIYASESIDDFVESNGAVIPERRFNLGQVRIGGEVAYLAGAFEPYATALYQRDFTRTSLNLGAGVPNPGNDKDDVLLGLGIRYYGDMGLSGSLEYTTILGRDHLDEDIFTLSARWQF